jgi:hypothetical protein
MDILLCCLEHILATHNDVIDCANKDLALKYHAAKHVKLLFKEQPWRSYLFETHPVSFAFAALIEVLGWWAYNGIDQVLSHEPVRENGQVPMPAIIQSLSPPLRSLCGVRLI